MKFGVREICDVVLKAKATMKVGNKVFYANEPVLYFDTLKTSSLEGASTTVYAQGGRGNARLMAWDGERTVTFTMEDALISPESFMVLSGAGLIEAKEGAAIYQHATQILPRGTGTGIVLDMTAWSGDMPYEAIEGEGKGNYIYGMLMYKGDIVSEPYILVNNGDDQLVVHTENLDNPATNNAYADDAANGIVWDSMLIDYYIKREEGARQINITPESFGGNFYLEASTLFRDTNGVDMPAEFIIPNCKIQSNFTFTMASSGDPSTFTFTMDAFPDYTRFNKSEKVLASIQIIESEDANEFGEYRIYTNEGMKA